MIESVTEQVIWEECVDAERCLRIFGRRYCIRISVCIRIIHQGGSYYLELDAFGQRWRWNLTRACYVFYEVGIARFKICAYPRTKGVRLVLEGCLGVDKVRQCWVLFAKDVTWFDFSELEEEEFLQLGVDELALETAKRYKGIQVPYFGSMDRPLNEAEIEETLAS